MAAERAETGRLHELLAQLGSGLDGFLRFEHPDAQHPGLRWRQALEIDVPQAGVGIDRMLSELLQHVVPHGSSLARPGACSFITTGGTTASALAATAAGIASPQRYGHTAFNLLEELSLRWLAEMFGLAAMQGVYCSGGSVANLLALGAARQRCFERLGRDPAQAGVDRPVAIYASTETHHTIKRAAGVLGLGRSAVRAVPCDAGGRMRLDALQRLLDADRRAGVLPMAIVANAGTTNTGAIDPLHSIGELARALDIWFHVDGAYGLPGLLDTRVAPLYRGLERADSVIVDPHKWLGAAVGIGATFVRDRELLRRAFTQEPADYLEGSMAAPAASAALAPEHSMDDFGLPYYDFGVELSAPCRGVVVWALIREIGVEGLRDRVRRHNDMATHVAQCARRHANLELLQEPTLSICCFRYVAPGVRDLNDLNQRLHRQLTLENRHMPSTTRIRGQLALRPCYIGARSTMAHAEALVADVLRIGAALAREGTADPIASKPQAEASPGDGCASHTPQRRPWARRPGGTRQVPDC
jgi:aromatic-L-amino-acid/L-tryptophan decarboxylase